MKDEQSRPRQDLKVRTKQFSLRIIRVYSALPASTVAQMIGKQLLRAGTSVGAHYREAVRSRSDAEFISKLEAGLQELDETEYWLELLVDAEIISAERLMELRNEANELIAIFATCVKNAKARKRKGRMRDEA
jgi:four helix bundle protein